VYVYQAQPSYAACSANAFGGNCSVLESSMITPSVEWFDIIVTFNYLLLREMEMHIVDFEEKCYYRLLGLLTLLPSGYVMY